MVQQQMFPPLLTSRLHLPCRLATIENPLGETMTTPAAFSPFSFSTVPNIVCEPGAVKRIGALAAQHFPEARRR